MLDAWQFVAQLVREFGSSHRALLKLRQERKQRFLEGEIPQFLTSTENIRYTDWLIAPIPEDLKDRRVEITGPSADTKMVINAFNSGANVYMSDFEDSQTPTWYNSMTGQQNLFEAVRGGLRYKDPKDPSKKPYALNEKRAVLMVRPRGWHLYEEHVLIDGKPAPASLVDFGLFFYHNAEHLLARGTGPYFYFPKLESHLEARLWNDIFEFSQDVLRIPRGSIKATVLIETLPAVFEMDEILYELRNHSVGLNCGRWDYIFSFIKTLGHNPAYLMPNRSELGMDAPFLGAYSRLLVATCHHRGAHAMGGMAAQIPIKNDDLANKKALDKVRADKLREVKNGHDGTWVAHPGLVEIARKVFDTHMPQPNQILTFPHLASPEIEMAAYKLNLLKIPQGSITEQGLRTNLRVGIQYLESWLRGNGCVPINNLMEDAATAEISRVQVWQWLHHGVNLDDGRIVDMHLVDQLLVDEFTSLTRHNGELRLEGSQYCTAAGLFRELILGQSCPEFLTIPAYGYVIRKEASRD